MTDTDYKCEKCQAVFGYYNGDQQCLRCDDHFDGHLASCPKCGGGHYKVLCPDCGEEVDDIDECTP